MKKTKKLNWGELLIPSIVLIFGVAFITQTLAGPINAMRWPYVIVSLTTLLLALVLWKFSHSNTSTDTDSHVDSDATDKPWQRYSKDLIILIIPIIYIFIMQYIGFALASVMFLTLMFRLLGSRSWLITLVIAILMTTILYIAMIVLMQMPLPQLSIGTFTL